MDDTDDDPLVCDDSEEEAEDVPEEIIYDLQSKKYYDPTTEINDDEGGVV